MNKTLIWLGVGGIGYFAYQKYQAAMNLVYSFVGVKQVKFFGLENLSFNMGMEIQNPSNSALAADSFQGIAYFNGTPISSFKSFGRVQIAPSSSTTIQVPIVLNLLTATKEIVSYFAKWKTGQGGKLRLVGTIQVFGLIPLPFDYEFPLTFNGVNNYTPPA